MGNKKKKEKKERSSDPKQIRARARRAGRIQEEELAKLYKPLDEWDMEELARGRPRDAGGGFRGKAPSYITRTLHEDIVRKFQQIVKTEMNHHTVEGLAVLGRLLTDDDVDDKGKPIVPASTKAEIAKFLIEHVVGKPTQRVEQDISIRLQAILATATVTVDDGEFKPGLPVSVPAIEASSWEADDDDTD